MKSWYLIHSKPKEEILAQEHLERQGYETYLPLVLGKVKKRGKVIRTVQPMFPRYLFIHLSIENDDWGPIRSTIGVSALVRFGMEPAKIPERLIDTLKNRENSEGIHEIEEKEFKEGEKVIISEGPFEGYEAIFASREANERVSLLLKIAEKLIKIQMKQELVEPLSQ